MKTTVTKYPTSTDKIKVEYADSACANQTSGFYVGPEYSMWIEPTYSESLPSKVFSLTGGGPMLIMRLTLKSPNESLTNFDASVSFKFEKA